MYEALNTVLDLVQALGLLGIVVGMIMLVVCQNR